MRVITKFTGALLVGICGVLGVFAWDNHRREVAFFEHDMRLDHEVVGDALAAMVRSTWQRDGKAMARQVPKLVGHGERQLQLATLEPGEPGWQALDAATQQQLAAHATVVDRANGSQRTLLPVDGPHGEALALVITEPLAKELVFSRDSWVRLGAMTLLFVVLCSAAALASGYLLVDRPIRALGARARAIGAGDLEHTVEAAGSDEFASLARDLDAMRVSLHEAKVALAVQTEQRIATLEQLRHADRLVTVGRLAAGIAHELGTPLNVVGETAKMIQRGELKHGEVADGAHTIAEQAQRMAAIIRQLLDFARPRSAVKLRTEIAGLVDRTLHLLETVAQKRQVALRRLPGEPLTADLDPAQMQQVLTNLVVNAVQATPAGGRVELSAREVTATPPPELGGAPARWLCIEVRDTGGGISAENQRRLFEPFFTTKGVGEGTGLGLSVSRGIVREHGGWIAVESTPAIGTCFAVHLPVTTEVADGR